MSARYPVSAVPSETALAAAREEADHDGVNWPFNKDRIRVDAAAREAHSFAHSSAGPAVHDVAGGTSDWARVWQLVGAGAVAYMRASLILGSRFRCRWSSVGRHEPCRGVHHHTMGTGVWREAGTERRFGCLDGFCWGAGEQL